MTLQPLDWVEQTGPSGWATAVADDGEGRWRVVAVPRDVTRIYYSGKDGDGTVIRNLAYVAHAESTAEALIVVDILRAGTDHLPGWREQLEAAGFVRTYPDSEPGSTLSALWHDQRKSGLYQITVSADVPPCESDLDTFVGATYEADRSSFWHNVVGVRGGEPYRETFNGIAMRDGLPAYADGLKAGVAAAIAIRAARIARGGRFVTPIGSDAKTR